MFTDNFCRYEFKFPVSYDVMNAMLEDLSPYVEKDAYANRHGFYCLSSIYFDNDTDQCYHETMNGQKYRQKIRLRVYRSAGDMSAASGVENVVDEQIGGNEPSYFEIKAKINGLVVKRRVKMKLADAMAFTEFTQKQIDEDIDVRSILTAENTEELRRFSPSNLQILRELQFIIVSKKLRPRNVVSYERLALFVKNDPELRITFDLNIRTRGTELDLSKGTGGKLSCPENVAVLEIKTGKEVPLWLVKIVSKYGYRNKTFSKYCSYYVNMLPAESLYAEYVETEHGRHTP
ncbi:MAG: polyphosphate polymerase domain-containing protein [Clostridia bacterium]|nr:polyphosphate polymerase domain-containing protein [Clostridia bacterium]